MSHELHNVCRRLDTIDRHIDMQMGVMKAWRMVLERMVQAVERLEKVASQA
jgi:hypothetical protein